MTTVGTTISVLKEDVLALVAAYRPLVDFCLADFESAIEDFERHTMFRKDNQKAIAQVKTRMKIVGRLTDIVNALQVHLTESKKDLAVGEVVWGDAAREGDEDDERDDGEDWWDNDPDYLDYLNRMDPTINPDHEDDDFLVL